MEVEKKAFHKLLFIFKSWFRSRAVGSSEKQRGDTLSSEELGGQSHEIDLEKCIFEVKIAKVH